MAYIQLPPILRSFVKKENHKIVLYFIILSIIFQFCLTLIEIFSTKFAYLGYVNTFLKSFKLDFVYGYVAYYLLGWYLVNIGLNKISKTLLYVTGAISLIVIIVLVQLLPISNLIYSNYNILVLLYSAMVFTLARDIYKPSPNANSFFKFGSAMAFGVYIIHPLVIELFSRLFPYLGNPLLHIIVEYLFVCIISFLCTYALSKIPFIKKIIRG